MCNIKLFQTAAMARIYNGLVAVGSELELLVVLIFDGVLVGSELVLELVMIMVLLGSYLVLELVIG